MVAQRDRIELLRDPDVGQPGVVAVAEREVDQPVDPRERNGGFGAVIGEQLEAPSGSSGEDEDEDPGKGYEVDLPGAASDERRVQRHLYST